MRSFIAACLILAAVVSCTSVNKVYLHRQTSEMSRIAEALPVTPDAEDRNTEEAVIRLRCIWQEHQFVMSLTVPNSRTDKIERALNNLDAGWRSMDEALYLSAREELLLALQKLHEAEDFSLSGLL
ncbi:MAG: DUF4363 family protein [Eubacteriales bacterium]